MDDSGRTEFAAGNSSKRIRLKVLLKESHEKYMTEFVDSLQDVFTQFGEIEAKRMFGGHGVYHEGLMFGLVADDVLYLKADAQSAVFFNEMELPPFEYEKKGKLMRMSYYMAPEVIFDDPGEARMWANRAFEAALRSRKSKK